MNVFFRLAANTFSETIRESVFFLMACAAVLLISQVPMLAFFVFSEQLKLVSDSAMGTSMIFSLLAAVLAAANTLGKEMRKGTVLLLFSKPVARWQFIFGKITGIALASTLFCFICNAAGLIAIYMATDQFHINMVLYWSMIGVTALSAFTGMAFNFFKGDSFSASGSLSLAGLLALLAGICAVAAHKPDIHISDVVKAMILIQMGAFIMSAAAAFFASKFDTAGTLLCCTAVFVTGMISGFLFKSWSGNAFASFAGAFFYALFPNWQYFWMADALAIGRRIPWRYLLAAAGYSVIYTGLLSLWTLALFRNHELAGGGDSR